LNLQPTLFYDLNSGNRLFRYNYTVLFDNYAEPNPLFNTEPTSSDFYDLFVAYGIGVCNSTCIVSYLFDLYTFDSIDSTQLALLQNQILLAWFDQNADSINRNSISVKIVKIESTWTTPDG
jgi:hypothetical protein